jgi:hypothetical protein
LLLHASSKDTLARKFLNKISIFRVEGPGIGNQK